MTPEQKKQLKKLMTFKENQNLAIFDELQELNKNIATMTELFSEHFKAQNEMMGEMCTYTEELTRKEAPTMPEIPEMDMTETNNLLKELLKESKKPKEPIEITLDVE